MEQKDIDFVVQTCERLDKIITKYIAGLGKEHDLNVTVSILANMGTTIIANALAIIHNTGNDPENLVEELTNATMSKLAVISADIEADAVLSKMMKSAKGSLH